ncbi:NAD-dependent epimerase/dehydratase family protein [Brevirhabdus pacifica]|nr:NAD-dependent epimerase/dehydratase family protein [Brevirhabdus pacifica]
MSSDTASRPDAHPSAAATGAGRGDPFADRPKVALVTGSAGFIGYHVCARLLAEGWQVIGVDALSDYYDVALKERRHAMLNQTPGFTAHIARIETPGLLQSLFSDHEPSLVVHLAAQAGVRYSIDNPRSYVEANLLGTFELLEAARAHPPVHMLLASTSSAYGANAEMPYRETHKADAQVSFYAATKKATEAMAHSYAHLYDLPCTMFRFFTVYGPWGRPDMALFKFTKAVLEGRAIEVFNHGDMQRDFTYVDDLVEGIRLLADALPPRPDDRDPLPAPAAIDPLSPVAPFRVVNIGNGAPVRLLAFIEAIESATGRAAEKTMLPMQPGDMQATWADTALLEALTGYRPRMELQEGVQNFVDWYRDYYRV